MLTVDSITGLYPVSSAGSGSGSGGSVWITTGYLRGHGLVSARGGTGNTYGNAVGGSGSGGRIAAHVLVKDEYRGGLEALGGPVPGTQHGGSGTVYIEEVRTDKLYTRLYIDNQNASPPKVFLLDERNPKTVEENMTEENSADFGFDELMLQRQVSHEIKLQTHITDIDTHTDAGTDADADTDTYTNTDTATDTDTDKATETHIRTQTYRCRHRHTDTDIQIQTQT